MKYIVSLLTYLLHLGIEAINTDMYRTQPCIKKKKKKNVSRQCKLVDNGKDCEKSQLYHILSLRQ